MAASRIFRGKPAVIEISLPWIYNLAETLEPLTALRPGVSYNDVFVQLFSARMAIDGFLNNSVFMANVRSCRQYGVTLMNAIDELVKNTNDRQFDIHEVFSTVHAFGQFKTAMLAEIGVFPAYFVTQKASFDTLTLLNAGQLLFPIDLHEKVPEAIFDAQQAAKALAFEISTAAGFHTFRATETVLRRYFAHVTGGDPQPRSEILGYMSELLEIRIAEMKLFFQVWNNWLSYTEIR
jgi:hypothetical protein